MLPPRWTSTEWGGSSALGAVTVPTGDGCTTRSNWREDLPEKIRHEAVNKDLGPPVAFADLPSLDELERRYIIHVLQAVSGSRTRAAEVLGIDRRTLYKKAERYGINLKDTGE